MSPTDYEAALLKNKSAQKRKDRKEDQNNGRMRSRDSAYSILFFIFCLIRHTVRSHSNADSFNRVSITGTVTDLSIQELASRNCEVDPS